MNKQFTYIAAWIGVLAVLGINIGSILNETISKAEPFAQLILVIVVILLLSRVDWNK